MHIVRRKLGNSGSTMIEAAVIMPVVIMAIISVMLIIVFLTYSAFYQVNIHKKLIEGNNKTAIEEEYFNGKKALTISDDFHTTGGLLLPRKLHGNVEARIYEIDEKKTIRYADFFEEQITGK